MTDPIEQARKCQFCEADAEQGMDNGAGIIWTCMGHEDDGTPVDRVMQARRRYNRAVSDHYANLYDDEEWADVPQSETYHKMRTLGEVFEQAILRYHPDVVRLVERLGAWEQWADDGCPAGLRPAALDPFKGVQE